MKGDTAPDCWLSEIFICALHKEFSKTHTMSPELAVDKKITIDANMIANVGKRNQRFSSCLCMQLYELVKKTLYGECCHLRTSSPLFLNDSHVMPCKLCASASLSCRWTWTWLTVKKTLISPISILDNAQAQMVLRRIHYMDGYLVM